MTASESTMKVRVSAIAQETSDIRVLELRPVDGELPEFSAGSHIDLHLGTGLVRSYSLTNPARETHRYVIGGKNEPLGRGGSRLFYEKLGTAIQTTTPTPPHIFPHLLSPPSSLLSQMQLHS